MKSMLALIVPPTLEEPLIDWFLVNPDISGFTTHTAYGHGSRHVLSAAEQVTGRRNQIVFWVELEQELVITVIESLHADFSGSNIHYWQLPLTDSGVI